MKPKTSILITACAVPALWAFTVPGDRMAFAVESGSSLTKTFVSENELSLDDMTVVMNGEEMDMSMLGGVEMNVSTIQTIQVTDQYAAVDGGRASKLQRTYDKLGNEMTMEAAGNPMMPGDSNMSATSELEGMTVVFEWDGDESDYIASFADGEDGDEELLTDLFGDMDLNGFLPSEEVSAGDSYEIDAENVIHLLAPGGNLKIVPEDLAEMMGMPGGNMNPFENFGDFDGTVSGEYLGSREVDGVNVGVVKVTIDVTTTKDLTELIAAMTEDMELPDEMGEMEMDYDSVDIEFEFEGTGELLWDLSGGHVHAFDVSGEMRMAMDMAYAMSMQGMEMDMEMSMEMSGNQSVSVSVGASE